jgi:hypothetical protein
VDDDEDELGGDEIFEELIKTSEVRKMTTVPCPRMS